MELHGLRKRQRAQVTEELIASALTLFTEHGYDAVSVDDIVTRAGVSQRTFFRYFPTKEDVALHLLDATGPTIRDALAERPQDEAPLESLRQAFLTATDMPPLLLSRGLIVMRLATSSTRLMAGLEARRRSWEEAVAAVLVARLGPGGDDRIYCARVWAAAATSITMSAALWSVTGPTPATPRETVERAFSTLEDLLAGASRHSRA